jgi:hypothetical protein
MTTHLLSPSLASSFFKTRRPLLEDETARKLTIHKMAVSEAAKTVDTGPPLSIRMALSGNPKKRMSEEQKHIEIDKRNLLLLHNMRRIMARRGGSAPAGSTTAMHAGTLNYRARKREADRILRENAYASQRITNIRSAYSKKALKPRYFRAQHLGVYPRKPVCSSPSAHSPRDPAATGTTTSSATNSSAFNSPWETDQRVRRRGRSGRPQGSARDGFAFASTNHKDLGDRGNRHREERRNRKVGYQRRGHQHHTTHDLGGIVFREGVRLGNDYIFMTVERAGGGDLKDFILRAYSDITCSEYALMATPNMLRPYVGGSHYLVNKMRKGGEQSRPLWLGVFKRLEIQQTHPESDALHLVLVGDNHLYASAIQRKYRGSRQYQWYKRVRLSTILLQALCRGYLTRRRLRLRAAALVLQLCARSFLARRKAKRTSAARKIQSQARGVLARRQIMLYNACATKIQKEVRRHLAFEAFCRQALHIKGPTLEVCTSGENTDSLEAGPQTPRKPQAGDRVVTSACLEGMKKSPYMKLHARKRQGQLHPVPPATKKPLEMSPARKVKPAAIISEDCVPLTGTPSTQNIASPPLHSCGKGVTDAALSC